MKNQILEVGESCGQKEELVKRGNYIKGFPSKVLTEMRAPCSVCINGWRLEFYLRDIIFCGQHHSIITIHNHTTHTACDDGVDECNDDPDVGMECTFTYCLPCKKTSL